MQKKIKMSKEDFQSWKLFRISTSNKIQVKEFKTLCQLHSKYFQHQYYEPCTCSKKTINDWIAQLNAIHDNGY
tara:strand:- start:2231 stop:2449 length:219 start_codon:yes stop_codon:yes gene_type:complete